MCTIVYPEVLYAANASLSNLEATQKLSLCEKQRDL